MVGDAQAVPDEQRRARRARAAPSSGCPRRRRVALSATMRSTSVVAGNGAGGRASSGSVSASCADRGALTVRSSAFTVITGGGAEDVEGALRVLGVGGSHGAPPATRGEAHGGLDRTLSVPAPRRTGLDDRPVVLGHRSEGGLDVAGSRHDHRGQAVGPPHPSRPAQAPQHLVDGLDEVGLVHLLGQHAADLARVRQRAQQHVGRRAPRSVAPLEPVPLDLFARWVVDLDGVAALDARAGFAVRPEPGQPHLADEARDSSADSRAA